VRQVSPDFEGKLSGFTLLFEALVLLLAQQMPFAAVARSFTLSPALQQTIAKTPKPCAVVVSIHSRRPPAAGSGASLDAIEIWRQ
jgi:hypothetical protein